LRQIGGFLQILRFPPPVSDLRQVGGFLRILRFPPPVSDLRHVGGFLRILRFPPPMLKVAISTINHKPIETTTTRPLL
jgi:hypothetical protein